MSWFTSARLILTLKCDRSTQLASESLDRELTGAERVAMRLHELLCRHCRRFRRQIAAMEAVVRLRREAVAAASGDVLSARTRIRIVDSLNQVKDVDSSQ